MKGGTLLENALQQLVISNNQPGVQLSACIVEDKERLRHRFAYLAFIFSMGKASEVTWYDNIDECSWQGVTCANQRISRLRFVAMSLRGSIPADVGFWSFRLLYFNIFGNMVTGVLPTSIGRWYNLENFEVGRNKLTGSVPAELSEWRNIQKVYFNENGFSGTMPPIGPIGRNFCPKTQNTTATTLRADCRAPAEITCSCCDECCADTTNCVRV
jgi:hypothetical protein